MSKKIEMVGRKFGRLTVIEEYDSIICSGRRYLRWKCICDCGNVAFVKGINLRSGHTISCGCYREEAVRKKCKKDNVYDLTGEYGVGYDSNGNSFTFDLEDYDIIKQYCWHIHRQYSKNYYGNINHEKSYVITNCIKECNGTKKRCGIRLHRLIMGIADDNSNLVVDHIDGNGCNNIKSNLRICSQTENTRNVKPRTNTSSIYKGVHKARGKWVAKITKNNKEHYLGSYETEEQAAEVYNKAATELFGEFARLNEIHYDNEIKEAI